MNPFKYGCAVGGEHFCSRPKLERQLRSYILSGQNVVMQGERRMGKTSLVLETVRKARGVSLIHADLLCVRDTSDLCRRAGRRPRIRRHPRRAIRPQAAC